MFNYQVSTQRVCRVFVLWLGPSINRLVTEGYTKIGCLGFVLAQFQSTTAYKIDSEHTLDYILLFLVCKGEILQGTVNKIEVLSSFLIDFWRFTAKIKVTKIAEKGNLQHTSVLKAQPWQRFSIYTFTCLSVTSLCILGPRLWSVIGEYYQVST